MYLVMLKTNGNQRYIFSSPRLRENIGASYQLTQLEPWVEDAWRALHPDDGCDTAWVSRSSGKVILLVDTEEEARTLIGEVTRRALAEAPGIDVSGVYLDMGAATHVDADALQSIDAKAIRYGLLRRPAEARFSRMPFLDRGQDSVLPAAPPLGVEGEAKDDRTQAYSLPSRAKRHLAHSSSKGLLTLVRGAEVLRDDDRLATSLKELEDLIQPRNGDESRALSKVAVIHIDGNGVGTIMRDLHSAMKRVPRETFRMKLGCEPEDPDALRRFSLAVSGRLKRAVDDAFVRAWGCVASWVRAMEDDGHADERTVVPIVPVIVGGDDVTVITSGDYALPFAAAYLDKYEEATYADDLLASLGSEDDQTCPMTAAAGVAVVRRSFPFHIAYELAERLVKRAKDVGKPVGQSTIDYHVLFDTTVLDAREILRAYATFTTRPFRLAPDDDATPSSGASAPPRHASWRLTCERVAWFTGAMPPQDRGVDPIPFPKSRAARIRRLLSDAASAEDARKPAADAHAEWRAAATELKPYVDIDDKLGGPEAVFDLLELSELLPEPYLRSVLGVSEAPKGEATAEPTSTPEEARA